MNRLITTLTLVAAFGFGAARAADTYDVTAGFIPGPAPQSPTAVWQYFEASFDRMTMILMQEWRLTGNDVLPNPAGETIPQWDNMLGNGQYPFVQKTPPGGPWPGNYGALPFPGDSLYLHPAPDAGAPGAAVGWYNNSGATVTVSYNVTWSLIQIAPGFNDTGVTYYVQRQTVGDPRFFAVTDGFLGSTAPTATQAVSGIDLLPGEFLYFGLDNAGTYYWDHTRLQLDITLGPQGGLPSISKQPEGAAVLAGTDLTLSVTAVSTLPLSYQWQKNGAPIPGATASTLLLSKVTQPDAADYRVVVANARGSAPSNAAKVTVALEPALSLQLNQSIVVVGSVSFHYRVDYREAQDPPADWKVLLDIPVLPSSPYWVLDPTPMSATNQRSYRTVLVR